MTTITSKTILRSRNAAKPDKVLSTLLMRYPRWIHAEGRTHRLLDIFEGYGLEAYTPALMDCDDLSRNAASSRAIPVEKLIADILADPAIPLHWGLNQRGMQSTNESHPRVWVPETNGYIPESGYWFDAEEEWLAGMHEAIARARRFVKAGYHKQIVNRILEPYSHITVLISATEWSNFLGLRDHGDAEPHIAMLAREVRKCLDDESTIQTLQPGEWHLPFFNGVADYQGAVDYLRNTMQTMPTDERLLTIYKKISVSRCASTSYRTVDGFDMTVDRAVNLHDKLVASAPLHASPCEHVAQAAEWVPGHVGPYGEWRTDRWAHPWEHGNLVGFRQYRKQLPGECL